MVSNFGSTTPDLDVVKKKIIKKETDTFVQL
jgi:hypothetical protein